MVWDCIVQFRTGLELLSNEQEVLMDRCGMG